MMKIIRAADRHFSDFGWLKTYWLFSFGDYYDLRNLQFSALRVFNDDVVLPGKGFPTHPHEEMEIITVVFDGEITHEDSLGNKTVIRAGDVQRMSAGTGITHSEFNLADEPVQFCQIWIYPEQSGLTPSYDQRHYDHTLWQDDLYAIASGQNIDEVVTFHADATIYRADLAPGVVLPYQAEPGRTTFLYLNSGELRINGQRLKSGDQLRAKTDEVLELHSISHSSFILIDLP